MTDITANLTSKIDEIFGFNLSNSTDGVNYNFGQYKLNQLYKPLVKYFIKEFTKQLNGYENKSDADQIVTLFLDFFKLYYWQGDFGYFKSKYSSFTYKVPYSIDYTGKDTEFRWATKDCYYVKTSDVVNAMDVEIPSEDLVGKHIRLQFFKKSKANEDGTYSTVDVDMEERKDEETDELLGYNITIYNRDETGAKAANKKVILEKIQELGIQGGPGLEKILSEFLAKRGRDFFIHKRLKNFLTGELERYLFQVLKGDTQGRIDVLEVQKQIEEIRAKYVDDQSVVDFKIGQIYASMEHKSQPTIYQSACVWITNFINILADLEEFKAKLWNKKRKVIKQDYIWNLMTLKNKIKDEEFKQIHSIVKEYILQNIKYQNNYFDILKEKYRNIDMISAIIVDNITIEKNGIITLGFCRLKEVKDKITINKGRVFATNKNGGQKDLGELMGHIQRDGKEYIKIAMTDEDYDRKNSYGIKFYKKNIDINKDIGDLYIDSSMLLKKDKDTVIDILSKYEDNLSGIIMNSDNEQGLKYLIEKKKNIDLVRIDPPFNTENNQFMYKDNYLDSTWSSMIIQRILLSEVLLKDTGSFYIHLDDNADYIARMIINNTNLYFKNQIIAKHFGGRMNEKKKIYEAIHDVILFYTKSENYNFNYILIDGEGEEKYKYITTVYDKYITTKYSQFNYKENISGYSVGETTQKTEDYLQKYIRVSSNPGDVVLDFFAGTGTTLSVAHKFGRKWVGINLSEKFDNIFRNRMKKVFLGDFSGVSKEEEVKRNGGGSCVCITLNQYEDRFAPNGYLSLLESEISKLAAMDDVSQVSHILVPLQNLKDRIYTIDDTLNEEQLIQMSSMITEK